jgi:lipopolysaccharide transport system permease protein
MPLCTVGVCAFAFATVFQSRIALLRPIFYSLESVPERLRWIIALNPLTTVVVQSREALFAGRIPE